MVRTEFVIVGCILILIGLVVGYMGYQKTQPTLTDKAIGFVEQLANERAPAGLRTDTTPGYLMMAAGAGLVLCGLWLVLNSRKGQNSGSL